MLESATHTCHSTEPSKTSWIATATQRITRCAGGSSAGSRTPPNSSCLCITSPPPKPDASRLRDRPGAVERSARRAPRRWLGPARGRSTDTSGRRTRRTHCPRLSISRLARDPERDRNLGGSYRPPSAEGVVEDQHERGRDQPADRREALVCLPPRSRDLVVDDHAQHGARRERQGGSIASGKRRGKAVAGHASLEGLPSAQWRSRSSPAAVFGRRVPGLRL